jgi:hypothetical protein
MGSLILSNHGCKEQSSSNYENSFGAIIGDIVVIYQYDTVVPISIENLIKVSLHKRRNYFLNFISFVFAFLCVFAFIYIEMTSLWHLILVGVFISVLFLAFKTKWIEYSFLVVRFNLNFIELKVRSNQKENAIELIKQINAKLMGRSDSFITDELASRVKIRNDF